MKGLYLFVILFVCTIQIEAQDYYLGCIDDPEEAVKIKNKPRMSTRSLEKLPSSHSLRKYCPYPKSQGSYGTCTSWSLAYGGRTICEAIKNGWTDRKRITDEAFSPLFIHSQINNTHDNCKSGASVQKGLRLMKEKGVPKLLSFANMCAEESDLSNNLFIEASQYKLEDYTTLFYGDFNYLDHTPLYEKYTKDNIIESVKKALAEDRPVATAMCCYVSFSYPVNGNWNGKLDTYRGGHAMCIVGYDDNHLIPNSNKRGAFEIMNSWGNSWSNEGFIWVSYEDYARNAWYAYEMKTGKAEPNPIPSPTPSKKKYEFDGEVELILKNGKTINMQLNPDKRLCYYTAKEKLPSNTEFRAYASNTKSAWVYIISSDLTNNTQPLFPDQVNTSALLDYSENEIVLPDEKVYFQTDNISGTDYVCILYCQEQMDVDEISDIVKKANGSTFYDKIMNVFGNKAAPMSDLRLIHNKMGFSARTNNTVIPLIVELPHK
ncbi:MAG: C1 family peptidase [Bacteroidaceae bacterium]|nr:C1 family peptidase [Bacteroidaceae bacterium]